MPRKNPRKRDYHQLLSITICTTGIEMPFSCDRCSSLNKHCIVSEKSSSKACSECVLAKKSCSFSVVSFPREGLERYLKAHTKLEQERKAAIEELARASAKVARLERQSEFLRERGSRLVQESIASLEQLEALEEAERVGSDNPPLPATSSPTGEPDLASPGFWESLGVFENPSTPPVHSRDAQ